MKYQKVTDSLTARKIIIYLGKNNENYSHKISINLKLTYAHVSMIIKWLEKDGIIVRKYVDKRKKIINLTDKGKRLFKILEELDKV